MIALCFVLFSTLATTEDFTLLTKSSFGRVSITEVNNKFTETIEVDIGLRAVALNNPVTGVGEVVVRFDQFCDLADNGLERYMDPADCASCNDISANMVISVIIAAVSFLPTFFVSFLYGSTFLTRLALELTFYSFHRRIFYACTLAMMSIAKRFLPPSLLVPHLGFRSIHSSPIESCVLIPFMRG